MGSWHAAWRKFCTVSGSQINKVLNSQSLFMNVSLYISQNKSKVEFNKPWDLQSLADKSSSLICLLINYFYDWSYPL